MLGGEAQSVIQIGIIKDDVCMDMLAVAVNGKHILILVIEKSLAKLLPDKQSSFGSYLTGGE